MEKALLEWIRQELLESDLTAKDLRIVLDILRKAEEEAH